MAAVKSVLFIVVLVALMFGPQLTIMHWAGPNPQLQRAARIAGWTNAVLWTTFLVTVWLTK